MQVTVNEDDDESSPSEVFKQVVVTRSTGTPGVLGKVLLCSQSTMGYGFREKVRRMAGG